MTAEENSVEILLHCRNGQISLSQTCTVAETRWSAQTRLTFFSFCSVYQTRIFHFIQLPTIIITEWHTTIDSKTNLLKAHPYKLYSKHLNCLKWGEKGARLINSSACWERLDPVGVNYTVFETWTPLLSTQVCDAMLQKWRMFRGNLEKSTTAQAGW